MSCMICGKVADFKVKVMVQTFGAVGGGSPPTFAGVCAECFEAAKNVNAIRQSALEVKHLLASIEYIEEKPRCPECGCKRHYGHAPDCRMKEGIAKIEGVLNLEAKP